MAGYQTIEALRPILHRGPPVAPVVDRALIYKPRHKGCATYAQIQQMIALRGIGESTYEIAKVVGLTRSTVRRHTAHIEPPEQGWKRGGRAPRVNREFICRLRRAGFTHAEIAEETGYHESNIAQILNGWRKKAKQKARPTIFHEEVVARVTGFTRDELRSTNLRGANTMSKARAILCWLVRFKNPKLSFADVAKHLGGYDRATPRRGHDQVCRIVAAEKINTSQRTQDVVRALWELDWSERQV